MSDHPRTITLPAVQLPVLETDVLVAGAGTAGCIAAIAAARQGASVILIEKLPVPGGTYTNGGIGANSFYAMSTDPSTAKRVVGGIPYELNQRLVDLCGGTGYYPTPNDPHHNPYRFVGDHEIYKGVVSQMLLEAGITVYLQTTCYDVLTENGKITAALIANKDGCSAIAAKQYIDASGDGDLARFAGLEQIDMWQDYHTVSGGSTGLVFGMAGVDIDRMVKRIRRERSSSPVRNWMSPECVRKICLYHDERSRMLSGHQCFGNASIYQHVLHPQRRNDLYQQFQRCGLRCNKSP